MSEFTWYSRLAAWIGAAMLLVQSALGRNAGLVSVLAVVLLAGGFVCFLVGLALDSRVPVARMLLGSPAAGAAVPAVARESEVGAPEVPLPVRLTHEPTPPGPVRDRKVPEPRVERESEPPGAATSAPRRAKFRERTQKPRHKEAPPVDTPAAAPVPGANMRASRSGTERTARIETEMLVATSGAVGVQCPRCGNGLEAGQLSATCPLCGRTHHALCWMENHFHCAALACTGHGSLEAPEE